MDSLMTGFQVTNAAFIAAREAPLRQAQWSAFPQGASFHVHLAVCLGRQHTITEAA